MEKLELHEIVGYLPYGLKFMSELDNTCKELGKHPVWTLNGITFLFSDYCLNTIESNDAYPIHLSKPILRPLSDLTKEIEVEGEKFVPVERLRWNSYEYIIKENKCKGVSYEYIQKLYSWHFDIHNLINRGLAIDIKKI